MVYLRYIYYRLFKGTHIHPSVVIEKNVYIGQNCVIGYQAEHKKFWGKKTGYKVVIKSGTIITGCCTIDAGTVNDTVIGENCFIMKGVHFGHDVIVGNNSTFSPHAIIGGHCQIGDNVNFGMGSIIHQRAKVPNNCMVGMNTTITKSTDMWENSVWVGSPARYLKPNNR